MANVLTNGAFLSAPSKKPSFFVRLLRAYAELNQQRADRVVDAYIAAQRELFHRQCVLVKKKELAARRTPVHYSGPESEQQPAFHPDVGSPDTIALFRRAKYSLTEAATKFGDNAQAFLSGLVRRKRQQSIDFLFKTHRDALTE